MLRDRWNDPIPAAAALADELAERYTSSDRRAYREQYLDVVLIALDSLEQLSTDPVAVRLAVWFHRAIHESDNSPADDADASAQLAEELLASYGVSSARVAEVARLVRLTGSATPDVSDANAEVLLDAVNATYAGANYATHASEVRRDARDRSTAIQSRYALVTELLGGPIYRTQLGRERFDQVARTNLTSELAVLDSELPAPWRGWQRAILIIAAVFSPLLGAVAAFGATDKSWRSHTGSDPGLVPGLLCALELGTALLLYFFARRDDRTAKLVGGAVAVAALAGLIVAWALVPDPPGVGDRVPLLITSLALLLLAGLASLASSWPVVDIRPIRNPGQLIAGLTTAAVIFVVTGFVGDAISRAYLLNANEELTGTSRPAGEAPRPELTGGIAWTSRTPAGTGNGLREAVATRHGIAISREQATIEMLDPATGKQLWRYTRYDSSDLEDLHAVADGGLLLANFRDIGYLVLDAATGKRKETWPRSTAYHQLESVDPLLTGEQVSKGSDKLRGADLDGDVRWTFEPGRCTSIGATATADTVISFLGSGCDQPDRVTALDLKSGKKLWSRNQSWRGTQRVAVGGVIAWIEADDRPNSKTLVGVEPRTGAVKWQLRLPLNWACETTLTTAGDRIMMLDCPSTKSQTVVTAVDAATGDIAWQRTAPVEFTPQLAVTTDARVVTIPDPDATDGCSLAVIEETGYREATLPEDVECRGALRVVGNQILVSGGRSVIALR